MSGEQSQEPETIHHNEQHCERVKHASPPRGEPASVPLLFLSLRRLLIERLVNLIVASVTPASERASGLVIGTVLMAQKLELFRCFGRNSSVVRASSSQFEPDNDPN